MQNWRERLQHGLAIPAHPLALDANRKLDERRQRALSRYYLAAGAGGLAVGVHTTQFAIRNPSIGLFRPVLTLAAEEARDQSVVLVAGACGDTRQAVQEASLARELGYHAVLLSLAALPEATVDQLIEHTRAVGEVMPVIGFYLQPAVGGRRLPYEFWRRFAELPAVVAIKIAPFNRYQTLDVLRGVAESGRASDIALYTGNDDHIVLDLLTRFHVSGRLLQFAGGLLGHWAVWTRRAVELLDLIHKTEQPTHGLLTLAEETTQANAALFDAANNFHGCIAGLHEVLLRQGLLQGRWCLDPHEDLSSGQLAEIDRIYRDFPHLHDDDFVAAGRDTWLRG